MSNASTSRNRTLYVVQLGLLTAFIILFSIPPFNAIKFTLFSITLAFLPVSVGAVVLDTRSGALLGLFWGIASVMQAFANVDGGMAFIQASLPRTLLALIVPRVLAGLLTGLFFHGMRRLLRRTPVAVRQPLFLLACVLTPLLNSVGFLGGVFWLFPQFFPGGFLKFVGAVVGINTLAELLVGAVVGTALSATMFYVLNKRKL